MLAFKVAILITKPIIFRKEMDILLFNLHCELFFKQVIKEYIREKS